jgi:hypothetical protein
LDLTPVQTACLERLVARGFTLAAFPLYANAIGVRRGSFAALLTPRDDGGLRVLGTPTYLLDGNLTVLIHASRFVWKKKSVEATPVLMAQLAAFGQELQAVLAEP